MLLSIQTHTRQYAKRQMTWFNADQRVHWLEGVDRRSAADLAGDIAALLRSRDQG
jgi:tRNA A37 N6-isopentenylltransferase MiaA